MGWNRDTEGSLLECAVGSFVVRKDEDEVTEGGEYLCWSEEVGRSCTGEEGEAPNCLGPVGSGGGDELSELSVSHGRCLPARVAPLEEIPRLEDGVNERVFEGERESSEVALENYVTEISFQRLRGKTSASMCGPSRDLKWERS